MKTKTISLLLALLLLASLMSGCSGQGNTSAAPTQAAEAEESPATQPQQTAPAEADASEAAPSEAAPALPEEVKTSLPLCEEKEELTLFTSFNSTITKFIESPEDNLVFQTLEERTNVHVSISYASMMSYNEKFMLLIVGGELPDLLSNVRSTYSGGLAAALGDDIIVNLAEYAEYAPNYMAIVNSDENIYKDVTLGDGKMGGFYGVYSEKLPLDAGLMMRGDWLEELGLEAPETVEQYYDVLKAFNTEYGAVMHLPTNGIMANQAFMSAYDIAGFYIDAGFFTSLQCYTVEDGVVKCGLTDDGFKQYLTLLSQWYAEGLIDKDYVSSTSSSNFLGDNSDALAELLNDKIGLWGDSLNMVVKYQNAADPDFRAQPTVLPTLVEGDTVPCGAYASRIDEAYYSITTACENIELAMRWVDYSYTEEGSLLFNWGVDGMTYTVSPDGSKQYTDLIFNNPEGMTTTDAQGVYLGGGSRIRDMEAVQAMYNDLQRQCVDVWNSNFTGEHAPSTQLAMTVEESEFVSNITGNLITYLSECVAKFIVGDMSIENDYDEFLQNLEAFDIERLNEIQQEVYDRWSGAAA